MKFPAVQAGWLNKVYEPSENGKGTIKYSSSYENMKVTEYLLDSSIWNQKYLDTEKGDWVIGASTLELLVESYNKKNENYKVEIGEVQEFGYDNPLKEQDILGNIDRTEEKEQQSLNIYNHGYSYWLASPSKTLDIYERGVNYKKGYVNSNGLEGVLNIRPVVRLKTGTILKLNSDGTTYTIE